MKLKPLSKQVIVVFGASSGIGRQAALDFAKRGARVAAVARGEDGLRTLIDEIHTEGGEAFYAVADAVDFGQVKAAADEAVKRYGRIDTWVHTAGVLMVARVEDTTPDEFKRVIEVNLLGQINGTLAAIPHLRQSAGALIMISSVEAIRALPLQSAYAASKHGISGFLQSLRAEFIHEKAPISITEIMPAVINSPIWETARNKTGKKLFTPLPPSFHPKIVSDAILYAAENPIRRMIAGSPGLGVEFLGRISPALADNATAWVGYRQLGEDPADPDAKDDLFSPVTESDRVEGHLGGVSVGFDPVSWIRTRRPSTKLLLWAGGLAGTLAFLTFMRNGSGGIKRQNGRRLRDASG